MFAAPVAALLGALDSAVGGGEFVELGMVKAAQECRAIFLLLPEQSPMPDWRSDSLCSGGRVARI